MPFLSTLHLDDELLLVLLSSTIRVGILDYTAPVALLDRDVNPNMVAAWDAQALDHIRGVHDADDLGAARILDAQIMDHLRQGRIHDQCYLYKLADWERLNVDLNFGHDCRILAAAVRNPFVRLFEQTKARLFSGIVDAVTKSGKFPTDQDRNTDITRAQGIANMDEAKRWINLCALKVGRPIPYPEVAAETARAISPALLRQALLRPLSFLLPTLHLARLPSYGCSASPSRNA